MAAASEVVDRAAEALIDPDEVRWTETEKLEYLTDALRALQSVKPDLFEQSLDLELGEGVHQDVPETADALLDVYYNLYEDGAPGKSIRRMSEAAMRRFLPSWEADAPTGEVEQFSVDLRYPGHFMVWPPALAGMKVRGRVIARPEPLTATTDEIPVSDIYVPALTDYVLYRCFAKDSESPAAGERANWHLQLFNQAIGATTQGHRVYGPRVRGGQED